jgi:hypothetical protein
LAHLIGLRLASFLLKRKKLCDAEPGKDPMAALVLTCHPDGTTTTATSFDGRTLHSHSPPSQAA